MFALLAVAAAATLELHDTSIEAHVTGPSGAEPLFLRDVDEPDHPLIPARTVEPAEDVGGAIAILIQTDENMMGDDHGLYAPLRTALDHIGRHISASTVATIVGYDSTVHDLAFWQGPTEASGAVLGSPKDYLGRVGSELGAAMMKAAYDLGQMAGEDPVLLIVIGDGNDTNNEQARELLQGGMYPDPPTFAIIVKTPASPQGDIFQGIKNIKERRVVSADGIEAALVAALDSWHQPVKATFDVTVPHDGRFHTYAVVTEHHEVGRNTFHLLAPPAKARPWWFYAIIAVLGLGAVIAGFRAWLRAT
jgi:hypothetical protein